MTASRGRLRLARALAGVFAVLWGFFFFGLSDLLVIVIADQRFHQHYLLESGWGLLYLVLVAVPFVAVAVRPVSGLPVTQVLVVAVAVAAAAWPAGYPQQLLPAAALVVTALAVWWAARLPLPSLPRVDLPLGALAAVALPAGALYAWSQAHDWRALAPDITVVFDHRPMQAALGLAVPLVAALGAVAVGSGWTGRRVPVWTVAVTAVWLGVESVAYPDLEASLGTALGTVAAVWGVAFAAVAEVRARGRRTRAGVG